MALSCGSGQVRCNLEQQRGPPNLKSSGQARPARARASVSLIMMPPGTVTADCIMARQPDVLLLLLCFANYNNDNNMLENSSSISSHSHIQVCVALLYVVIMI